MMDSIGSETDILLVERRGAVAVLTLNMPEARNPCTGADMIDALVRACSGIEADPGIRVAIITGAGKAFSSGGNIKHMRDKQGIFGGAPHEVRDNYRKGIQRVTRAVHGLEVPTIAAVNGPAYGAGCDLALMCDMRVCSDTAVFAENFVKVGIIPGDGGAWLLPRAVGRARAAEMAFTGEPIDAATALEWGLVSRVVSNEDLMNTAFTLAERVAANPPQMLRMTKRLMREADTGSLETVLEMSAAYQALCHHTRDHEEAVAAIMDKRAGVFTGD